ncbi:DedA family protein [Candidatus Kaiserbacteria bacterium]|nr:DedA family protein [Candidatus Kaiserbacteria bacterium]
MSGFIIQVIDSSGYWGIAGLMFLENLFPPIPSELILPFVGYLVAEGSLSFFGAVFFATVGGVCGTLAWFALGWYLSIDKIDRWFLRYGVYIAISHKDFVRTRKLFEKYKIPLVLFGRMLPTIRTVISVPAGSIRMNFKVFLLCTVLGTMTWNILLMVQGLFLHAEYERVADYIDPVVSYFLIFMVILYIGQIVRFHWQRLKNTD